MNRSRNYILAISAACCAVFAAVLISNIAFLKQLEDKTLDYRYVLRHALSSKTGRLPATIDTRLFFVGIDDYDVQLLGHWPWPRTYHAILLEALAINQPQVVGFDILFTDPDTEHADNDMQFVRAVKLLGNVVLAAFLRPPEKTELARQIKTPYNDKELDSIALTAIKTDQIPLIPMVDIRLPFKQLRETALTGFANAPKDDDGLVRRIPFLFSYKDRVFPSFALKVLMELFDIDATQVHLAPGQRLLLERDGLKKTIPLDASGRLLVNFRGKFSDFNQVNFRQVLKAFKDLSKGQNSTYDLGVVRNKIVIVGTTATGLTDTDPTPMSTKSPLVMVHLNALNSILGEDYVKTLPLWHWLVVLFLVTLLTGIIAAFSRPFFAAVFSLFVLVCYSAVSALLFFLLSLMLPWIVMGISVMLCFVGIFFVRFFSEEKEKKKIKRAFGNYLSHNVLEQVLKDNTTLQLGGIRKEITVLFLDIVGFTGFSEQHTPEEVVHRLNEVFSELTEIIFDYDGTFDKYVGDELIAFWGAPQDQSDHAQKAVFAAIEMTKKVEELQSGWRENEQDTINIGIGINTGQMLVGNMGSDRIMDYTVIGDEVNLAARIEGLSRNYSRTIIISDQTFELVKDVVDAESLGEVTVKGRKKSAKIYGVIDRKVN